jgi:hypothetical protein
MSMQFHYLPGGTPVFDTAKARARFAAAKADYLAGGSGPEVCERHGLSLRTFRWRARKEGWRRADQPAPSLAPDPLLGPTPAPPSQHEPLVIPEAPEAPSGTPLTTLEMVDKCWSMLQAAVAAGQLIQARGWLRLYRELKPLVPDAEIEARDAQKAREAAENPAGEEDVARPLHCFSEPEPPEPEPEPDPTGDLVRLTTRLAAAARQAETAALRGEVAPLLHCFSGAPSGVASNPDDDLTRLVAELNALTGKAERALADQALALRLHCFSDADDNAGPGP